MVKAVIFDCFGVIRPDRLKLTYREKGGDLGVDRELLNYIAQLRQTYKTAVLSNVGRGRLKELIGTEDAERCFDVLVESGALGFAKPDSQIYEYAADQVGTRLDECVFTDDTEEYCQAARTVGMQAIHYRSFEQFKRELEPLLM